MSDNSQARKLFVGGLSILTTQQTLQKYFSKFGKVDECSIMINRFTGKSRCFGFVTMKSVQMVSAIIAAQAHQLDGKTIDWKLAVPVDSPTLSPVLKSRKVFVGGIPYELSKDEFREYFIKFGEIEDCIIMLDKNTGNPRGFGFITYKCETSVEKLLDNYDLNYINGKWVEVKIATPKQCMAIESDEDSASTETDTSLVVQEVQATRRRSSTHEVLQKAAIPEFAQQKKQRAFTEDFHEELEDIEVFDEATLEQKLMSNITDMIGRLLEDDDEDRSNAKNKTIQITN